mgnify:CR=1 FL=1
MGPFTTSTLQQVSSGRLGKSLGSRSHEYDILDRRIKTKVYNSNGVIEETFNTVYDDDAFKTYYYYTDSTKQKSGGKENFLRHSIRPKFKFKLFDENLVFDYRFYFKPKVGDWEDYLLEHELKISFATFFELLTIDLNYTDKYNSRFDVNNGGQDIINPLTLTPYKERDKSLILGLSFSF